jgi:hypothetical protein
MVGDAAKAGVTMEIIDIATTAMKGVLRTLFLSNRKHGLPSGSTAVRRR